MEPMYVDNVTTAIKALFEAFKEDKAENDEHFRNGPYEEGSEEFNFKIICSATSTVANSIFKTMTGREPRYLIVWVDGNKMLPTFPIDATREELMNILHHCASYLSFMPITQQEDRESKG